MDSYEELHAGELRRLEDMAARLLQGQLTTPQALWAFEIELAHYQIELQDKLAQAQKSQNELQQQVIARAKARVGDWKAEIQALQHEIKYLDNTMAIFGYARTLARQLGDALAWIMLGMDERHIIPLTKNQPVPSTTKGLGLKGMLFTAEWLANAGAGFPIIHDITHCLRVGDITFILPPEEPFTIEVKTRLIGREENIAHLQVEWYAPAEAPRWKTIEAKLRQRPLEITELDEQQPARARKRRTPDAQLGRQLSRMHKSRVLQTAQPGVVWEDSGHNQIVLQSSLSASAYHGNIIRELAQEAKVSGFASQVVDDALVYVAVYTPTPHVHPYEQDGSPLPYGEKLQASLNAIVPRCAVAEQNHLWFGTSYAYLLGDVPVSIRPFFLYPLPLDLIMDLMWGRLAVIIYVNLGKLVEAIERSGLRTQVPTSPEEFKRQFLPIWTQVDLPNGMRSIGHLAGLPWEFAAKMAYEFLGVDGFVTLAVQAVEALLEAARSKSISV